MAQRASAAGGSTKASATARQPVPHADGKQSPAGRVAARGLFAGPAATVPADLYSTVHSGVVHRERDHVVVAPNARWSTRSYFGRFPASYWQRWTSVPAVTVSLHARGSGRVSLLASDSSGDTRVVDVRTAAGTEGEITLSCPLDKFVDGGSLWVEVTTDEAELTVRELRWIVPEPARSRRVSMVICTCNRADDCLTTLAALAADPAALRVLDTVYVADQGTDTVDSRERFAEVRAALGDKLRYLQQPNLGGSGGFTRGLYEVAATGDEQAGVLFMDDDVLLDPEITIRLTAFADSTVKPAIVGGQMLNLLHPSQLLCSAEYADLEVLKPGLPAGGTEQHVDQLGTDRFGRSNLQESRVDAGYNGWWACLIPAEVIRRVGYPLPLFFQWDDVEYGYRAHAHDVPTVTLPSAAVWHADFHWKDWDEWHRYFNLRNSMITAALHTPFRGRVVAAELGRQLVRYLLGMQYGLAATLLKAVEDFLAGPDVLHDGGMAAMAEIRRIRSAYPETVKTSPSDPAGVDPDDVPMVPAAPEPRLWGPVTAKRIAYHLLGRSVFPIGAVPAGENAWWHVSLFDTAVVTDSSQEAVRVRRRDRDQAIALAKRGSQLLSRLVRQAPGLKQTYRDALPRLAGRENWTRLYRL